VQAIRIIQGEHRALAAVLHGMLHVVREIRYFDVKPNFELLGAMTYYIQAFPERLHHPKEEAYLFKFLRLRHPDAAPLLDRLHAQHQLSGVQVRAMQDALVRYQQNGAGEFPAFAGAVAAYAAFHWDHANIEDNKLLPLARNHLTTEDWKTIDAAFMAHADPLLGTEASAEFNELFRKIVSLAPPPLGIRPKLEAVPRR